MLNIDNRRTDMLVANYQLPALFHQIIEFSTAMTYELLI